MPLQLGDIGIGESVSPRALPDDDYVVLLLRACLALRLAPRAAWSISIMAVPAQPSISADLNRRAPPLRTECPLLTSPSLAPQVHDCASLLSRLVLDVPSDEFTATPREVKGDLISWEALLAWLQPSLPDLKQQARSLAAISC